MLKRMRDLIPGKENLPVPVQLPALMHSKFKQPVPTSKGSAQTRGSASDIDPLVTRILSTLPTVWSSRWIVSVAAFSIFVSLTHDTLQHECTASAGATSSFDRSLWATTLLLRADAVL